MLLAFNLPLWLESPGFEFYTLQLNAPSWASVSTPAPYSVNLATRIHKSADYIIQRCSHPPPQSALHCLTLYVERRLRSVNHHSVLSFTLLCAPHKAKTLWWWGSHLYVLHGFRFFSLPRRGSFSPSLTVLVHYRSSQGICSAEDGPHIQTGYRVYPTHRAHSTCAFVCRGVTCIARLSRRFH